MCIVCYTYEGDSVVSEAEVWSVISPGCKIKDTNIMNFKIKFLSTNGCSTIVGHNTLLTIKDMTHPSLASSEQYTNELCSNSNLTVPIFNLVIYFEISHK